MSIIGNNIRALRTLFGNGSDITQEELAEIAGVTRETVNKWESGVIGNIRDSNLNRLRQHFSLSIDDLRSEELGLAAKLHRTSYASHDNDLSPIRFLVPLVEDFERLIHGDVSSTQMVELPAGIYESHPRAFAIQMNDDSMSRILPVGSLAIIDPDAGAYSGSVVLIEAAQEFGAVIVRRLQRGSSKVLLVADSYTLHDDIIMDIEELHVLGRVVWNQAASEHVFL